MSQDIIILKVGEVLEQIGIAIKNNDGTLKSVYGVLQELSNLLSINPIAEKTKVEEPKVLRRGDEIPEQYKNVPRYSFSKMNTFDTCKWAYYLNYILNEVNKDNIWSIFGGAAHDILENVKDYNGNKEKMAEDFLGRFYETVLLGYKFATDEEKNDSMMDRYKTNVLDYFNSYYEDEVEDEEKEYRIFTYIDGHLIGGYVDRKFTKDGKYYIQDYKTSSMYSKEGKEEAKEQLIIYAKDLVDKGVNPEDIIICWDFIKYANISMLEPYKEKIEITDDMDKDELIVKGLIKTKRSNSYTVEELREKVITAERSEIGMKIRSTLKKIFKSENIEDDELLDKLVETNDLTLIPLEIVEKYKIKKEKCIIYEHFDDTTLKQIEEKISDRVVQIISMEDIYNKSKDESVWERMPIEGKESFYCSSLCGLNHACKYYKDYLEAQQLFVNDEHKEDADRFRGNDNEELDINTLDSLLKGEDLFDDLDDLEFDDIESKKEDKKEILEEDLDFDSILNDLFDDLD